MALKCQNPSQLRQMVMAEFGPNAYSPIQGKMAFRIGGVICNVYDNGTVYFQGVTQTEEGYLTVKKIENMITVINSQWQ